MMNLPLPATLATVFNLIQLAIAVTLLLVARLLMKPKNRPKNTNEDEQPTTLSGRGMYLPYPIGRMLIGYGFGWAGDDLAEAVEEPVEGAGGGKGLGGAPPGPTQTIWFMPGWHQLCPGIVTKLEAIEDNGEEVWRPEVPLTPQNTPSGTLVDAGSLGQFEIYWGEDDQPVSEFLSTAIGVFSRWPGMCHIVWVRARLGPARVWPQRRYLVEKAYACLPGLGCPYMLDNGTERGVNPAWVLYTLFSAERPDGCDLELDQVDRNFLEALCVLCAQEHLPLNHLISDGDTPNAFLNSLFYDLGITLVDDRGVLTGRILRPPAVALPILDDDVLTAPDLESTIKQSPEQMQLVVFLFKDHNLRWRDNDITYQDDYTEGADAANPSTFNLVLPTDYTTAEKVAARRLPEVTGDRSVKKFNALRNARRLLPGDAFSSEGQPFRVASILPSTSSPVAIIDAFLDSYAISTVLNGPDVVPPSGAPAEPEEDLAFTWFELPASIAGADTPAISVFRIRAHAGISGANIWVSADSGSYTQIGQQNAPCAGGQLLDALGASTDDVVATGPTFETWNDDISQVRDLSGDTTAWQNGSQIAILNDEALFLQAITAVSSPTWTSGTVTTVGTRRLPTTPTGLSYVCTVAGTTGGSEPVWPTERLQTIVDGTVTWQARGQVWRLDNLIRARLNSVKGSHAIGDTLYIAQSAGLRSLSSPLLAPGVDVCLKSQPFVGRLVVDLTAITEVCGTIVGLAFADTFLVTDDGDTLVTHTGDRLIVQE